VNQLIRIIAHRAPALIAASGERASYRFLEFFAANVGNSNTRRAYARAAKEFLDLIPNPVNSDPSKKRLPSLRAQRSNPGVTGGPWIASSLRSSQ
jgi:flagellar basal body rod protein FlgG